MLWRAGSQHNQERGPMRVLFVIPSLARCGPVNVLLDIVRPLADEHEVVIATLKSEGGNSRAKDFAAAGARVVCLTATRRDFILHGRRRLNHLIAEIRPDVVHSHGYWPDLLSGRLKLPTVSTVHNNIYEDFRHTYGAALGRVMEKSQVKALGRMGVIIACSQTNSEHLAEHYRISARTIRNGVNQGAYTKLDPVRRLRLREKLNFGSDSLIVVATGGCSRRKHTLDLILGFQEALAPPGFELYILGDGPQLDECRQLAGSGVHVVGAKSNVVEYLQASDLFVSLSESEGMPLAVLEALSCGLPVLLSDIGPHREIAEAVGDSGYCELVGPTAQDLKCALAGLLRDMDGIWGIGETGQFSSDVMAREYLSVYRELAQ